VGRKGAVPKKETCSRISQFKGEKKGEKELAEQEGKKILLLSGKG